MKSSYQANPITKQDMQTKFNLDMTRKDPIQVTFLLLGRNVVVRGEFRGFAFADVVDYVQVVWIDKQMNRCNMKSAVNLHNVLLME